MAETAQGALLMLPESFFPTSPPPNYAHLNLQAAWFVYLFILCVLAIFLVFGISATGETLSPPERD